MKEHRRRAAPRNTSVSRQASQAVEGPLHAMSVSCDSLFMWDSHSPCETVTSELGRPPGRWRNPVKPSGKTTWPPHRASLGRGTILPRHRFHDGPHQTEDPRCPKGEAGAHRPGTCEASVCLWQPRLPGEPLRPQRGPLPRENLVYQHHIPPEKRRLGDYRKDTCGMPLTRSTNDPVTQQNVSLFRVEKQRKQTYIRIPAGQRLEWTPSSQGRRFFVNL